MTGYEFAVIRRFNRISQEDFAISSCRDDRGFTRRIEKSKSVPREIIKKLSGLIGVDLTNKDNFINAMIEADITNFEDNAPLIARNESESAWEPGLLGTIFPKKSYNYGGAIRKIIETFPDYSYGEAKETLISGLSSGAIALNHNKFGHIYTFKTTKKQELA